MMVTDFIIGTRRLKFDPAIRKGRVSKNACPKYIPYHTDLQWVGKKCFGGDTLFFRFPYANIPNNSEMVLRTAEISKIKREKREANDKNLIIVLTL